MKKVEYIERYGIDVYNAHLEKVKQYNKANKDRIAEYKEANKDRIAEYGKQYYQDNKERIAEYHKQYRQDNKERIKQWKEDNKERIAEYNKEYRKQWYQDNKDHIAEKYQADKDHIAERMKQYYSTQFGRANNLKNGYIKLDKRKRFPADQVVDEDWIIENIFGSQCIYCGESDWTKLGCDRIDNTKGHTADNCVCACEKCNIKRNNKYTVEEFKEYRRLHPKIEDFLEKQSAKY